MNLLSQWWSPSSEERQGEIRECREANESSGLFRDVHYVDAHDKTKTYRELFSLCADKWPGQLCVVANTDIIFDETIRLLEPDVDESMFVALTRWDSPVSPRMIGHVLHVPKTTTFAQKKHYDDFCFFAGSQDVWAFIATDKVRSAPDIPLGIQACDQGVAAWAIAEAFRIINPCLSVKTWHWHKTPRQTGEGDLIYMGLYAYPQATTIDGIHETMVGSHEWTKESMGKPIQWSVMRDQKIES
jgi:hypothetical protein